MSDKIQVKCTNAELHVGGSVYLKWGEYWVSAKVIEILKTEHGEDAIIGFGVNVCADSCDVVDDA